MSEPMRPFPMVKYLAQYIGFALLVLVVMMLLSLLVRIAVPETIGYALIIFVVLLVGQSIARNERRELTRGERARFATWASLLMTILSAFISAAVLFFMGFPLASIAMLPHSHPLVLVSFATTLVLTWLMTYFALGVFIRQVLKLLAKRDQSAAKQ